MSPTISVAMIVRDEGDMLRECLENIRPFVDQICIVDTGSTDNTADIARDEADRFTTISWPGDFSVARNESLRLCTGDWTFVLDADERVNPEEATSLRDLAGGPATAYRFITRNYTRNSNIGEFCPASPYDPLARGFPGWHPSRKVRLFPQCPGIRFEGAVHELVERSVILERIPLGDAPVVIHHYPELKSHASLEAKRACYVRLGKAKIAANPNDARAHAELGHLYAEMGDFGNAAMALREAARLDPSRADLFKDLGGVLQVIGRPDEALKALQIATRLDPGLAEGWRNLGIVLLTRNDAGGAVDAFRRALQSNPSWHDGHRYLSNALQSAGELEAAAAESRRAVELQPESDQAIALYRAQMEQLGRAHEAAAFLEACTARNPRN